MNSSPIKFFGGAELFCVMKNCVFALTRGSVKLNNGSLPENLPHSVGARLLVGKLFGDKLIFAKNFLPKLFLIQKISELFLRSNIWKN